MILILVRIRGSKNKSNVDFITYNKTNKRWNVDIHRRIVDMTSGELIRKEDCPKYDFASFKMAPIFTQNIVKSLDLTTMTTKGFVVDRNISDYFSILLNPNTLPYQNVEGEVLYIDIDTITCNRKMFIKFEGSRHYFPSPSNVTTTDITSVSSADDRNLMIAGSIGAFGIFLILTAIGCFN